jgi:hypothetical protein
LSEGRTRREFILRRTLTGWLTVFGSSDSWTVVSLRHTGPLRGALSIICPCLCRCSGEACPRPSVLMANWFNFNSIGTCILSFVLLTSARLNKFLMCMCDRPRYNFLSRMLCQDGWSRHKCRAMRIHCNIVRPFRTADVNRASFWSSDVHTCIRKG